MITIVDSLIPFLCGRETGDLRIDLLTLSAARLATNRGYVDGCNYDRPDTLLESPPSARTVPESLHRGILFCRGRFYSVSKLTSNVEREHRQPIVASSSKAGLTKAFIQRSVTELAHRMRVAPVVDDCLVISLHTPPKSFILGA